MAGRQVRTDDIPNRCVVRANKEAEDGGALPGCDAMGCDAMRCDGMRCDAMVCDAMRCDAMRCDAMRWYAMRCDAMRCDAMKKSVIHPSTPTQARTLILTLAHSRPHASRIPEKDKTSSLITPPREAGLLDAGQSEHDRTTRIGIECFTNVQGKRS